MAQDDRWDRRVRPKFTTIVSQLRARSLLNDLYSVRLIAADDVVRLGNPAIFPTEEKVATELLLQLLPKSGAGSFDTFCNLLRNHEGQKEIAKMLVDDENQLAEVPDQVDKNQEDEKPTLAAASNRVEVSDQHVQELAMAGSAETETNGSDESATGSDHSQLEADLQDTSGDEATELDAKQIEITVAFFDRTQTPITLTISPTTLVDEIISEVIKKTHKRFPPDRVTLIYAGKQLSRSSTIEYYGIESNSRIMASINFYGSSSDEDLLEEDCVRMRDEHPTDYVFEVFGISSDGKKEFHTMSIFPYRSVCVLKRQLASELEVFPEELEFTVGGVSLEDETMAPSFVIRVQKASVPVVQVRFQFIDTGDTVVVSCPRNATMRSVKEYITNLQKWNCHPESLQLIVDGHVLLDDHTLQDESTIQNGYPIRVAFRNKPPREPGRELEATPVPRSSSQQSSVEDPAVKRLESFLEYSHNEVRRRFDLQTFEGCSLKHFNIDLNKPLGQGSNGQVFQAVSKASRQEYALKKMFYYGDKVGQGLIDVNREIFFPQQYPHENICRVFHSFDDKVVAPTPAETELAANSGKTYYFLMDRYKKTLADHVRIKGGSVPEREAMLILVQLLKALGHISKKGYCHRDLKWEDIMIEEDGHVVLIDFGCTTKHSDNDKRSIGCVFSHPPEAFSVAPGQPVPLGKFDVWSAGLVAYQLCGLEHPFPKGVQGCFDRPPFDEERYPQLASVVNGLLDFDPKNRISAATAVACLEDRLWPIDHGQRRMRMLLDMAQNMWSRLSAHGRPYGQFMSVEEKLHCQFIRREYDILYEYDHLGRRSPSRTVPKSSSIPEFAVQTYKKLIETVVGMEYEREKVIEVIEKMRQEGKGQIDDVNTILDRLTREEKAIVSKSKSQPPAVVQLNPTRPASSYRSSTNPDRFTAAFFDSLARDIGNEWPSLARHLNVPEESIVSAQSRTGREIDRIVSILQLWSERFDSDARARQDKTEQLAVALAKIGLISVVKKHLGKSVANSRAVKNLKTSSCKQS